MGNLCSCFTDQKAPAPPNKGGIDDDDVYRSPACTAYNVIEPGGKKYIERDDLEKALSKLFSNYGKLHFGILV